MLKGMGWVRTGEFETCTQCGDEHKTWVPVSALLGIPNGICSDDKQELIRGVPHVYKTCGACMGTGQKPVYRLAPKKIKRQVSDPVPEAIPTGSRFRRAFEHRPKFPGQSLRYIFFGGIKYRAESAKLRMSMRNPIERLGEVFITYRQVVVSPGPELIVDYPSVAAWELAKNLLDCGEASDAAGAVNAILGVEVQVEIADWQEASKRTVVAVDPASPDGDMTGLWSVDFEAAEGRLLAMQDEDMRRLVEDIDYGLTFTGNIVNTDVNAQGNALTQEAIDRMMESLRQMPPAVHIPPGQDFRNLLLGAGTVTGRVSARGDGGPPQLPTFRQSAEELAWVNDMARSLVVDLNLPGLAREIMNQNLYYETPAGWLVVEFQEGGTPENEIHMIYEEIPGGRSQSLGFTSYGIPFMLLPLRVRQSSSHRWRDMPWVAEFHHNHATNNYRVRFSQEHGNRIRQLLGVPS